MAGRKGAKSNKTEHVLNLLSGGSGGVSSPRPDSTPTAAEPDITPAPTPAADSSPAPDKEAVPAAAPSRPLSPPILEVARVNHEALSETIHNALAEALQEELGQEEGPVEGQPGAPAESPALAEGSPPVQAQPDTPVQDTEPVEELPASQEEGQPGAPAESPALAEASPPVQAQPDAPVQDTEPVEELPAPQEEGQPGAPAESPALAEASPPVQTQPDAPADPVLATLPDGARLVNVMQLLVADKLERYVKLFGLCTCPRCLADTTALALSRLPAKYVVLPPSAYHPMLELYRARYDGDVTAQIVFACKAVMEAPRHSNP